MKTRDLKDIEIFTDDLPPIMAELIDLLGVTLAIRLVVVMAGQKRYIYASDSMTDESELVLILGREAAEKLCYEFQGTHIEYPSIRSAVMMFRRQMVLDMNTAGYDRRSIIGATSFSNRNIKRILEGKEIVTNLIPKEKGDTQTLDMFAGHID